MSAIIKDAHNTLLPRLSDPVEIPQELRSFSDNLLGSLKARGAIRLLKVLHGTDDEHEICCELIEGTVLSQQEREHHDPPIHFVPYDALSWCWGNQLETATIIIRVGSEAYIKTVKPDLQAALKALRHHQHDRSIWIDAICINQNNLEERNHQVQMMARIYEQARVVRIWLGPSTTSSDAAFLFLKRDLRELEVLQNFIRSRKAYDMWRALRTLMSRPWFSRRWVIQEVILAQHVAIHCGANILPWETFASGVQLFVELEYPDHQISKLAARYSSSHQEISLMENVSTCGAALLVDAAISYSNHQSSGYVGNEFEVSEFVSKSLPAKTRADAEGSAVAAIADPFEAFLESSNSESAPRRTGLRADSERTLEYLVTSLNAFNVSKLHDTFYALLGIAQDVTPTAKMRSIQADDHISSIVGMFDFTRQYPIDYRRSYVEACKDFLEFCIARAAQKRPSTALDVLCRPWATQVATHDADVNTPHFPSWITQQATTSLHDFRHTALVGPAIATHRRYSAAGAKTVDLKRLRFRQNLRATGNRNEFHVAIRDSEEQGERDCSADILAPLQHFSLYVKGFVLDEVAEVSLPSSTGHIPAAWAAFGNWDQAQRPSPPDSFWRTLVAGRGSDGRDPPLYYAQGCELLFKNSEADSNIPIKLPIGSPSNAVVTKFRDRIQACVTGRSLIKTKSGKLGLAARNTMPGDLVCILYGCSVPVILRRHGPKTNDVVEEEMTQELRFLASWLVNRWRQQVIRRNAFRKKWNKDQHIYDEWEGRMRELWKKDTSWISAWQHRSRFLVYLHMFRSWILAQKKAGENLEAYLVGMTVLKRFLVEGEKIEADPAQQDLINRFQQDTAHLLTWTQKVSEHMEDTAFTSWRIQMNIRDGYPHEWLHARSLWAGTSATEWKREQLDNHLQILCVDSFRAWLMAGTENMDEEARNKLDNQVREKLRIEWLEWSHGRWAYQFEHPEATEEEEFEEWLSSNYPSEHFKYDTLRLRYRAPVINWRDLELTKRYVRRWRKHTPVGFGYWARWDDPEGHREQRVQRIVQRKDGFDRHRAQVTEAIAERTAYAERLDCEGAWEFQGDRIISKASTSSFWKQLKDQPADVIQTELTRDIVSAEDLKIRIELKKSLLPNEWKANMSAINKQTQQWQYDTPTYTGRNGELRYECGKQRARLTEQEAEYYEKMMRSKLRFRMGREGARWYYQMLGECYVHGVMDGEAISIQTEKEIPATIFEIR